jgi:hypothetical protein
MKKALAVAGLGAAVAVTSLLGAGTASADYYDAGSNYAYIQGLNNNGIEIYNVSVVLNQGHTICSMLSSGNYSAYDAQIYLLRANPRLSKLGAYNWVGVATGHLCPLNNYLVYAPSSL